MMFLDSFLKGMKPQYDDDSIDRLNYYYTPYILTTFALILSARQYVGQPLQCWLPAPFRSSWEQYVENYCFIQNTFFDKPKEFIPFSADEKGDREIAYYQWVPFILGIQAICFYLPQFLWRIFSNTNGMTTKSLVKMARETASLPIKRRRESVGTVAVHIHECLTLQHKLRENKGILAFTHCGAYMTTFYLFIKALYLVQACAQFIILNRFLSASSFFWGYNILNDLINGREWEESGCFPRVTLCEYKIHELGTTNRHLVQCVLMINMFNEKVYLFLWFWLLGVFVATLLNLVSWVVHLSSEPRRRDYLAVYLAVSGHLKEGNHCTKKNLRRFSKKHLRVDGVLIMHLISKNAGDIVATEIMDELWNRFLQERDEQSEQETGNNSPALDNVDGSPENGPLAP